MRLTLSRKLLGAAPLGAMLPAYVATEAAKAGSPALMEIWVAQAIRRRCHAVEPDAKKADAAAEAILNAVEVTVEFT